MKKIHTFAVLAYKKSNYIKYCINSLLSQKIKSEIIICTSTPSEYLNHLSLHYNIPLLVNKKKHNMGSDWTFAYNQAKTKYVTLAHQDDIYLPDYTKKYLHAAENYANNLIVFSDYSELHNNKIRKINLTILAKRLILNFFYFYKKNIKSTTWKKNLLRFGSPISCPSVMYNKKNIGNFNFLDDLTFCTDWYAWINFANIKGDFVYIKDKLMLHRIHPYSQTTKTIKNKKRIQEEKLLFEKFWPKPIANIIAKLYKLSYLSNK